MTSAAAKAALFAQQTNEVFLTLLEIDHDDLSVPIRVVNNYADITSGGETYTAFPFRLQWINDQDENLPEGELEIDNVDRQIVNAVRSISGTPTIEIKIVLASSPNTIEYTLSNLSLRDVTWNAAVVSGKLTVDSVLGKALPGERFTPNLFPGLF